MDLNLRRQPSTSLRRIVSPASSPLARALSKQALFYAAAAAAVTSSSPALKAGCAARARPRSLRLSITAAAVAVKGKVAVRVSASYSTTSTDGVVDWVTGCLLISLSAFLSFSPRSVAWCATCVAQRFTSPQITNSTTLAPQPLHPPPADRLRSITILTSDPPRTPTCRSTICGVMGITRD